MILGVSMSLCLYLVGEFAIGIALTQDRLPIVQGKVIEGGCRNNNREILSSHSLGGLCEDETYQPVESENANLTRGYIM